MHVAVAICSGPRSFFSDLALAARLRYVSPPIAADLLATQVGLSRADLDAVTLESHRRATVAWRDGHYAPSIISIALPDGSRVERDELFRPGLTPSDLARFEAAFAQVGKEGHDAILTDAIASLNEVKHMHALPHCPPIADGAALILLGGAARGAELGLTARAQLVGIVEHSVDPMQPFAGGFFAMERILKRLGITLNEIGAIEFMEAFAAVPAKFLRDYTPDSQPVNRSGGHLALGHPMGGSGGILITTLLAEMERADVERGLAVGTAVSGIGSAIVLRRRN